MEKASAFVRDHQKDMVYLVALITLTWFAAQYARSIFLQRYFLTPQVSAASRERNSDTYAPIVASVISGPYAGVNGGCGCPACCSAS